MTFNWENVCLLVKLQLLHFDEERKIREEQFGREIAEIYYRKIRALFSNEYIIVKLMNKNPSLEFNKIFYVFD